MRNKKLASRLRIPDEMHDLSDRACGIVCAATLEERLEQLIRRRLVAHAAEPLFAGSYGPLASFAAKIDTARALGLVSKSEAEDLHQHRKIRNAFAHERQRVTFDKPPIIDHVRQLRYRGSVVLNKHVAPRADFEIATALMAGFLEAALRRHKHLRAAADHLEPFAHVSGRCPSLTPGNAPR